MPAFHWLKEKYLYHFHYLLLYQNSTHTICRITKSKITSISYLHYSFWNRGLKAKPFKVGLIIPVPFWGITMMCTEHVAIAHNTSVTIQQWMHSKYITNMRQSNVYAMHFIFNDLLGTFNNEVFWFVTPINTNYFNFCDQLCITWSNTNVSLKLWLRRILNFIINWFIYASTRLHLANIHHTISLVTNHCWTVTHVWQYTVHISFSISSFNILLIISNFSSSVYLLLVRNNFHNMIYHSV